MLLQTDAKMLDVLKTDSLKVKWILLGDPVSTLIVLRILPDISAHGKVDDWV
jgi:hypothetical protein